MRRLRALFFTLACVVGAVLGTAGATYAETSARCPTQQSRLACEEHLGPTAATPAGAAPESPAQPATVTTSTDPVPAAAVPADAVPADAVPADAVPADAVPADTLPPAAAPPATPAGSNASTASEVSPDPGYSAAGATPGLIAAGGSTGGLAPMRATAVLHVATPSQPASPGQMDPITDKAMVLLVGWVMLVTLGGGVCVGRRTDSPVTRGLPVRGR
ncbi:MAG TPA: hypothetical protein VGH89_10425 [Pseudonocardia sp.]